MREPKKSLKTYQENLHSRSWKDTYNGNEVIVIEKPQYSDTVSKEIEYLYNLNKEKFDKHFPKLIKVYGEPKRFVFEYIDGQLFTSFFLFKKIANSKLNVNLSYKIGEKLACFHNENIKNLREKDFFDEYNERIRIFENNYPRLRKFNDIFKEIILEVKQLKNDVVNIHNDMSPWNIILTKDDKIWFIDYFNSYPGFKCQDLWKFIFSIELIKFPLYPKHIKKKIITAFLNGYKNRNDFSKREFFLIKIICAMFFLTYFAGKEKNVSRFLKQKYLENKLKNDIEIYSLGIYDK